MSETPRIKDTLRLFAWVLALVLVGCLSWILTRPIRSERLLESVNRAWTRAGDTRRLDAAIPAASLEPRLARLGSWFTMEGEQRALIFTFLSDGVFFPCAAIVNAAGRVEELIALTQNGSGIMEKAAPTVKQLYVRRIEGEQ